MNPFFTSPYSTYKRNAGMSPVERSVAGILGEEDLVPAASASAQSQVANDQLRQAIDAATLAQTQMIPDVVAYQRNALSNALANQEQTKADVAALRTGANDRIAKIMDYNAQQEQPPTGFWDNLKNLGWEATKHRIGTQKINPATGNFEMMPPNGWGEGAGNAISRTLAILSGLGGTTQLLPGGGQLRSLTYNPEVGMASLQHREKRPWLEREYNDQFDPTRVRQLLENKSLAPGFEAAIDARTGSPSIDMPNIGGSSSSGPSGRVKSMLDTMTMMKERGYPDEDIQKYLDNSLFGRQSSKGMKDIYGRDGSLIANSEFTQLLSDMSDDKTRKTDPFESRFNAMATNYDQPTQLSMQKEFEKVYGKKIEQDKADAEAEAAASNEPKNVASKLARENKEMAEQQNWASTVDSLYKTMLSGDDKTPVNLSGSDIKSNPWLSQVPTVVNSVQQTLADPNMRPGQRNQIQERAVKALLEHVPDNVPGLVRSRLEHIYRKSVGLPLRKSFLDIPIPVNEDLPNTRVTIGSMPTFY